MPIFMRIKAVPGNVTGGPYAGWIELLGFNVGRRATRSTTHPGGVNFLFGDGSVRMWASAERVPALWILTRNMGGAAQGGAFTAEFDFTRSVGQGISFTDLRILMHGMCIIRYDRGLVPDSKTPVEIADVAYARMTPPGASISSPDITQQVRSRLEVYDWPGEYAQRFDGVDKG